jgi:hypothetical protein
VSDLWAFVTDFEIGFPVVEPDNGRTVELYSLIAGGDKG